MMRWRDLRLRRETLKDDAVAGLVLGLQSVPSGLATGLLAGVNPLAGLHGYLVGTVTGAMATSATFMIVQGTGAMAMVIADIPAVHTSDGGARALSTLAILTGVVMLAAGLLKLGSLLRFVSNAVMVGFLNAVGVNIALGQLANLTGYAAPGPNRIARALETLMSPGQLHWHSIAVGLVTLALILALQRTRVGTLGLVVAVVVTSGAVMALGWQDVAILNDLGVTIRGLPTLAWPLLSQVPALLVPALSLAFVGLVQGAGISATYANPDTSYPDPSRDFMGQGAANVASGFLRGMPVGGSLSASALNRTAGARSRQAPVIAGIVMVVVMVALGELIGHVAMPALAGLLILVGVRTLKPAGLSAVWRTGTVQKTVLGVTFLLTMLIPLHYAVLAGVGLSVVLHVVRDSNQVVIRRRVYHPDGGVIEVDPPAELPGSEVVVLQPYGSLFFAAAPVFEAALPAVRERSRRSVVILRLRGRSDLGTTFMEVLHRYALALAAVGSKLVIVSANERIREQLVVTGITDVIGPENVYAGDERVGGTVRRAYDDAMAWTESGSAPA
jgi:SulP family sulfate permease